ncbi:MAG: HTH domain-containing protein [Culicoidibacterales bacterium]
MSKKLFTEKEIKQLQKNPYVKNVTKKGVTYTDEMRKFFIIKKSEHIPTTMIFELAGFDTCVLGRERVNSASNRWMRNYKNGGELGLKDRRKTASGRPLQRTLSAEEKIARLEAKMKLLETENLFLKKLRQLESEVSN